eukprot:Awhi_evm1s13367
MGNAESAPKDKSNSNNTSTTGTTSKEEETSLRKITVQELNQQTKWIAIYGFVYDISEYIHE